MALLVPNHHAIVPETRDIAIFSPSMVSTDQDVFYIELFGDSIMCGKDPDLASPRCGVCSNADPISGRVPQPPGRLINFFLPQYKILVTTRSSGNSTSGQLLNGTDGVNGPWPDNIEANIVVINHGLNDAKNGIPVEEYKKNLISLREGIRPEQIMIWQTPTINYYWDTAPYAQAMREVAYAYDDLIADTHAIKPNWLGEIPDGVHPRQLGYVELIDLCLSHRINFAILKLLGTEPDQSHKFYRKDYQQKFVLEEEDEVYLDFKPTAHRWVEVYFRDNISYRVVSRGLRDKYGILDPGIYDARGGDKLYTPERSYNLIKIKRETGRIIKTEVFDVASDPKEAIRLADTLNATSNQYIIILMSHDDPRDNRLQPELLEAIYRCGASSEVFANPLFKYRSAYILVGIPGCGEGNGIEAYNGCEDATDENTILRPNKGLSGRKRKPKPIYYAFDGEHRLWSKLLNKYSIWDDAISANVTFSDKHTFCQLSGVYADGRGPAVGEGTLKNVAPTDYPIYRKAGTYFYTVPDGVTEIEVLVSGAGGSGADGSEDSVTISSATGGYAGGFERETVEVTPGETLTIVVGAGGEPVLYGTNSVGNPGQNSFVRRGTTDLVSAIGGLGGDKSGAVYPVDDYPGTMQDDYDEYWNNIETNPPGSKILWGNGILERINDTTAEYTGPTGKTINIYKDLELNNVALADPDLRLYFQQRYAFFPKQVTSAGFNNQGLIDFGLGGYGGNFTFEQTGGDGMNGSGGSAVEEVKSALIGHWTIDSALTTITENVLQIPVVTQNALYRAMPDNSKPSLMVGVQGLSWVEYPSTPSLSLATERYQSYTIEAWIYPIEPSGDEYWGGMILSKNDEYKISLSMQGKISVAIDWSEGTDINLPGGGWYETPVEIEYGKPSHVALVVDRDSFQIYVNSILQHTQPDLDRVRLPSTNPIYIGNQQDGGAQFKGYIADVRIWDMARTGADIANNINTITTGISDFKGSRSGRGGDGVVIIGTPDNPIPTRYGTVDLYFNGGIIPLLKNFRPNNGSSPTEDMLLIGEEVTQDDLLLFGITKPIDEIGIVLPQDSVDWAASFTADHHVRVGYWIWDTTQGPFAEPLTKTLYFGTYSAGGRQTDTVRGEFALPDEFSPSSILVMGIGDGDWKSGMHNVSVTMTSYVRNVNWSGQYYEWQVFFPKPDNYVFQVSADNTANLQIGFIPPAITDEEPVVDYKHVISTQGSRQLRYGTIQEKSYYIDSCGWYMVRMYAENYNDFIDPPEYYPGAGSHGAWSHLLNNYGVWKGDSSSTSYQGTVTGDPGSLGYGKHGYFVQNSFETQLIDGAQAYLVVIDGLEVYYGTQKPSQYQPTIYQGAAVGNDGNYIMCHSFVENISGGADYFWEVKITKPDNYLFAFSVDNYGSISIRPYDVVVSYDEVISYNAFSYQATASRFLSAGLYVVKIVGRNTGGPGGVAATISDSEGKIVWSTRDSIRDPANNRGLAGKILDVGGFNQLPVLDLTTSGSYIKSEEVTVLAYSDVLGLSAPTDHNFVGVFGIEDSSSDPSKLIANWTVDSGLSRVTEEVALRAVSETNIGFEILPDGDSPAMVFGKTIKPSYISYPNSRDLQLTDYRFQSFRIEATIFPGLQYQSVLYLDGEDGLGSTVFYDKSPRNQSITYSSSPTIVSSNRFGEGSMYFDGLSYIDINGGSDFTFDGDFTVEGWIYIVNVPTGTYDDSYRTIFEINDYRNGILFRHGDGQGFNNHFYVNNVNYGDSRQYFPAGVWNHFAITRNNGTVRLFSNGTLRFSGYNAGVVNSGGGVIRIGKSIHTTGQYSPPMYIDDFRVIKGGALYVSNFTPPDRELGPIGYSARYPNDTYWGGMIVNKDSEYELALKADGKLAVALDWGLGSDVNLPGGGWYETPVEIPLGKSSNIAWVVESTKFSIFVDGELKHTQENLDRQRSPSDNPVYIGNRAGFTQQFYGYISNVAIYKTPGPASERTLRTASVVNLSDAVSVKYYVNKGTTSTWGQTPENNESLNLEYSLNGSTWTILDTIEPGSVDANEWSERVVTLTDVVKIEPGVYLRFRQNVNATLAVPKDTWAMTGIVKTTFGNEIWHTRQARNLKDIEDYDKSRICDPFNSYSEIEFDISSSGIPFAVDVHPPRYEAVNSESEMTSFTANVLYDIVANVPPVNGTRLLNPQYPTYKTLGIPHETYHIKQYRKTEKFEFTNNELWLRQNDILTDRYDQFQGKSIVKSPDFIEDKISVFGYDNNLAICYRTFTGSNYADFYAPELENTNVVTVEMWCKIGSAYSGKMFFGWLYYDVWCSNGHLGFNTGNGDVYGINQSTVNSLRCVENWRHYVFVMRSDVSYTNNKIYINSNGQVLSQQISTENPVTRNFNSGYGRIAGWRGSETHYLMPMKLASFKVYNRELTVQEITDNFNFERKKYGI